MVKTVTKNGKILAIIIGATYSEDGVHFLTPNDFSQQLAFMKHPKGKIIYAHTHNVVTREVCYTKEVLVIRKGVLRVDFYDDDRNYIESHLVRERDVILLAFGGHGFEVLEDCEFIEIKQGPYLGDRDKIRFEHVKESEVKIVE